MSNPDPAADLQQIVNQVVEALTQVQIDKTIRIPVVGICQLTTNHPSSFYGIPVLVRQEDGHVFGPGDLVQGFTVADWVRSSCHWSGVDPAQLWDAETRAALVRFGVQETQR